MAISGFYTLCLHVAKLLWLMFSFLFLSLSATTSAYILHVARYCFFYFPCMYKKFKKGVKVWICAEYFPQSCFFSSHEAQIIAHMKENTSFIHTHFGITADCLAVRWDSSLLLEYPTFLSVSCLPLSHVCLVLNSESPTDLFWLDRPNSANSTLEIFTLKEISFFLLFDSSNSFCH